MYIIDALNFYLRASFFKYILSTQFLEKYYNAYAMTMKVLKE